MINLCVLCLRVFGLNRRSEHAMLILYGYVHMSSLGHRWFQGAPAHKRYRTGRCALSTFHAAHAANTPESRHNQLVRRREDNHCSQFVVGSKEHRTRAPDYYQVVGWVCISSLFFSCTPLIGWNPTNNETMAMIVNINTLSLPKYKASDILLRQESDLAISGKVYPCSTTVGDTSAAGDHLQTVG